MLRTHADMDTPAFDEWQTYAAMAASRQEGETLSTSTGSRLLVAPPQTSLHILRSSQLDAQRLDVELTSMLHSQFMRVFLHFQQNEVAKYEPELHAVILLLVFATTVARGQATPGSQLLNLRYRNERAVRSLASKIASGIEGPRPSVSQRLLFGLGYVLLPYAWGRLGQLATQLEWSQRTGARQPSGWTSVLVGSRAWSVLRGLEATYKVSAFANLLAFLHNGVFRSVLERLVGMRLVYQQACMTRVISFEYLNRQLVWQELSELLLFMLPLLDVAKLKKWMVSGLARLPSPTRLLNRQEGSVASGISEGKPAVVGAESRDASAQVCPICSSQQLLLPFEALPCRHVFCYYCLRSNCEADAAFACPLDSTRVDAMRRWDPVHADAGARAR